jgi:acetyltransferase-like isoleucine patch superfamily enzyme
MVLANQLLSVARQFVDIRNCSIADKQSYFKTVCGWFDLECEENAFPLPAPLSFNLNISQRFDRSPVGGQNVHLGVRFRRLLAGHLFARCGRNFKCFQHTEFSYGYNLEVGDDVVVHRHVLLDDRGGITLGDRVSISDYANIYSHTHSIVEQKEVTNARTVLEEDVRITYHATVLAGVRVKRNGMVGALAVATKDVRPYHVYVGIPAKSVRVKPNTPSITIVGESVDVTASEWLCTVESQMRPWKIGLMPPSTEGISGALSS